MHWVPPTGTCSHMCMWDFCVYVYLPYCTPSVFTHLSKCHSLLDTCTHLCCWHCPSHQLHSFSSACRWYGCHSTLSSNPPRRTADKGMSTASVAAAVHQCIHTTDCLAIWKQQRRILCRAAQNKRSFPRHILPCLCSPQWCPECNCRVMALFPWLKLFLVLTQTSNTYLLWVYTPSWPCCPSDMPNSSLYTCHGV